LFGFLSSNLFGSGLIEFSDRLLKNVPFVTLIYTSI